VKPPEPAVPRWLLIVALGLTIVTLAATSTQIDLTSQVKNVLPYSNGGSGTGSLLTGILRGGNPFTASELSGDATTSGSNAVTVVKINGGSVPASANLLGTNSSSQPVAVTVGSGLSLSGGTLTTSTVTFYQEVPSITCNGSNTSASLAHTPTSNASVLLFLNGVGLSQGSSADYTISSSTITFNSAPASGCILLAQYH